MDQYIKLQSKEVFRHSRGMTILDDERFMDFATNIIIDIGKKKEQHNKLAGFLEIKSEEAPILIM